MVKITFIEEHMFKLLLELGLSIPYLLDTESLGSESSELIKLEQRIGKYDYNNLLDIDLYFNQLLINKLNSIFLRTNKESLDRETTNKVHTIFTATREEVIKELTFKETYNLIVTPKGDFIVVIKNGFTNFFNPLNKEYKGILLSKILDLIPEDKLFTNFGDDLLKEHRRLYTN